MKRIERVRWARLVLFLAVVFLLAGGRPALADPVSGDICLTVRILETDEGATDSRYLVRMHSAALDEHMAAMHGYITQVGDNPIIVSGIANQVGTGAVYVNLDWTYKQKSPEKVRAGILQMKLNATTMVGTFYLVNNRYATDDGTFKCSYSSGTVAPRTCP